MDEVFKSKDKIKAKIKSGEKSYIGYVFLLYPIKDKWYFPFVGETAVKKRIKPNILAF